MSDVDNDDYYEDPECEPENDKDDYLESQGADRE